QYSLLLTPIFLYYLYEKKQLKLTLYTLLFFGLWSIAQLSHIKSITALLVSFTVFSGVLVFSFFIFQVLSKENNVDDLFRRLAFCNGILVAVSLFVYPF